MCYNLHYEIANIVTETISYSLLLTVNCQLQLFFREKQTFITFYRTLGSVKTLGQFQLTDTQSRKIAESWNLVLNYEEILRHAKLRHMGIAFLSSNFLTTCWKRFSWGICTLFGLLCFFNDYRCFLGELLFWKRFC